VVHDFPKGAPFKPAFGLSGEVPLLRDMGIFLRVPSCLCGD
jgi:hypothetical protein